MISEIVGLNVDDVDLDRGRSIRVLAKGRKLRSIPLWKSTAALLKSWLERRAAGPRDPVFPNRRGERMSRSGIEKRLRVAVRSSAVKCPSLARRRISPHTLRHTTAMHLLQAGVDLSPVNGRTGEPLSVGNHSSGADLQADDGASLSRSARSSRVRKPLSVAGFFRT